MQTLREHSLFCFEARTAQRWGSAYRTVQRGPRARPSNAPKTNLNRRVGGGRRTRRPLASWPRPDGKNAKKRYSKPSAPPGNPQADTPQYGEYFSSWKSAGRRPFCLAGRGQTTLRPGQRPRTFPLGQAPGGPPGGPPGGTTRGPGCAPGWGHAPGSAPGYAPGCAPVCHGLRAGGCAPGVSPGARLRSRGEPGAYRNRA